MPSFGENLRRERELRGVDLREMAEATKISIRFLQAIEDERVEILPGGIFPKAFVRQYAKYLGLDADRLVAEFVYTHGGEPAPLRGAPHEVRVDQGPPRALILAGVVLAVLGLIGWRVWASSRKTERAPVATVATAAPGTFAEDRVFPPPTTTLVGATPAGAGSTAAAGPLAVALVAQRASWVEARVDGTTVLNRVLSAGETQRFEVRQELVLSAGNAGGVAVTVNGRALPPLGREGEVKKGIAIRPDTLPALLAGQAAAPEPAVPASPRPSPRPRPPSPAPAASASPATLPVRPLETTRPLAPVSPNFTPVSPAPEA